MKNYFLSCGSTYDQYPTPFLHHLSSLTALQVLCLYNDSGESKLIYPPNLSRRINLRTLVFFGHDKLKAFPDVSTLINLKTIDFSLCKSALGDLVWSSSYTMWWKSGFSKYWFVPKTSLLESMRLLINLQDLNLQWCELIKDWTGLCDLVSLKKLNVSNT